MKSERLRTRLAAAEVAVRRNQRLIRLRDSVGGDSPLDAMRVQPPDLERLRGLYAEWGFKSLLASLPSGGAQQGSLW